MMQAPHLRPVMDAEQYQRERQRLRELYGTDADGAEQPVAKRDQALADLFARSGWTQERLAKQENKDQSWIVRRLRLHRFICYAPVMPMGITISQLTERSFRGYWEQTEKNDNEAVRFDAVIRLMQAGPAVSRPKRGRPPLKREAAREIVRPLVEAGEQLSYGKLQKEHGLSERAARDALAREQGRLEGLHEAAQADPPAPPKAAPIDPSILSASQQVKFAALEKRLRKQMVHEFDDRVQAEVTRHINETLLPIYGEKLATAELLMRRGKPFTQAEYRDILASLHPDCIDAERRNRAFLLVKNKEVLLRPEEKDRPLTGGLPSKEELLARMKMRKGKP